MTENEIAAIVVDTSFHIHKSLGPGLLESVYEAVLAHELRKRGLTGAQQPELPVIWEEVRLDVGFRMDLVVNGLVVVEVKSVEKLGRVASKVLLTYLRLSKHRLGLLINFGEEFFKEGVHRVVNGLPD